jgi:hypothetical protein
MSKTRPSVQKRLRDSRKLEKAEIKAARKAARKAAMEEVGDTPDGVDPDLVGIVAGPQPVPEDEEDEDEEDLDS